MKKKKPMKKKGKENLLEMYGKQAITGEPKMKMKC